VLKRFEDDGRPTADLPLVCWALEDSLAIAEERLDRILANFPVRAVGIVLRAFVLPLGRRSRGASDRLGHAVARLLLEPSATRDRLTGGIYLGRGKDDPVGLMEVALAKVIAAEPVEARLAKALGRTLTPDNAERLLAEATRSGAVSEADADRVREAIAYMAQAIAVDDFPGRPRTAGQQAA
jgi:acyl-CoA dehydrogenase